MIREILLGVHATAWLVVVVITAWRTGAVPAELWAVLPLGVGAIIGAFRADKKIGSDSHTPPVSVRSEDE